MSASKATARSGGKYYVFVNAPEDPEGEWTDNALAFPAPGRGHTTEREAWETSAKVRWSYPDAKVRYEHQYVVDVEADGSAVAEPPPPPPVADVPVVPEPGEWGTEEVDPEAPLPGEDWIAWLERLQPLDLDELEITHVASYELAIELWEDRSMKSWLIQRCVYGDPRLPDDDPKTARQIGVAWRGFFVKYDRRIFGLNPFRRTA